MGEFSLYAIDHAALETLVLRVLKAISEADRKEWAAFLEELRQHPCARLHLSSAGRIAGGRGGWRPDLTNPFEDERLTARTIPLWEDPRLAIALRELTQLTARHTFVGGLGRMQPSLLDLPSVDPLSSDEERAEFRTLDSLVLRNERPFPRHLSFLHDPDARCSYVSPEEVVGLANALERGGYVRRAARQRTRAGEQAIASFLVRLHAFVVFAAAEACSLYYRELRS